MADGIHANLAIVETIVIPLNRQPLEYPLGILEGYPMPLEVAAVLFFRPSISQLLYLQNINTASKIFSDLIFSFSGQNPAFALVEAYS